MNAHVKWLRDVAHALYKEARYDLANTCEEAADEIDRLSKREVELELALVNRGASQAGDSNA